MFIPSLYVFLFARGDAHVHALIFLQGMPHTCCHAILILPQLATGFKIMLYQLEYSAAK